jgi:hypothetical protein
LVAGSSAIINKARRNRPVLVQQHHLPNISFRGLLGEICRYHSTANRSIYGQGDVSPPDLAPSEPIRQAEGRFFAGFSL